MISVRRFLRIQSYRFMNTQMLLSFLGAVAANNNRPWFKAHRDDYMMAKADFEDGIGKAIAAIAEFDKEISHLKVSDTVYRFYRDTRFSPDKSPYKRHFGAYICAKGKKSLRGGYYIHVEPGACMLACGSYWLPTNILTSCRNEIMANIDEWRRCVESKAFLKYFGRPSGNGFETSRGFGMSMLKTCPAGFPRDYEFLDYLRLKDYCCWTPVADDFFEGDRWLDEACKVFKAAKPMMDFMNSVIDDYE